jgi:protein gp37
MADKSAIEWTDATWNPVTGCTKVSPGCDHCYAERVTERWQGKGSFNRVVLHEDRLSKPLKWRKPRRVFVNSMSDLFHDDVPDAYIAEVFSVMARAPQHTFQVLTKRHGRMRSLLNRGSFRDNLATWCRPWPLPNVWLGVSVEDQKWADVRVPALLDTPAAVRPMHADWTRSLRDRCVAAGVPFFFKQTGSLLARDLGMPGKGDKWDYLPQEFRIRDYPALAAGVPGAA